MSTEPEKYEAVIEYCTIGFFGTDQCPDCTGHASKQHTKDWDQWHNEQTRQEIDNARSKGARRREAMKRMFPAPDELRCIATTRSNNRCRRYGVVDDICGQHTAVKNRVDGGFYEQRHTTDTDYIKQFA